MPESSECVPGAVIVLDKQRRCVGHTQSHALTPAVHVAPGPDTALRCAAVSTPTA